MAEEIKTNPEATEEPQETQEEMKKRVEAELQEIRDKVKVANEALKEGKGRLALETPITAGDTEITELVYDFTVLTGLEYTEAMDSDMNNPQLFKITSRQALALFAVAAAKQTPELDKRDIMERIGMTDSVAAVQLATLFFSASTRTSRLRISKK